MITDKNIDILDALVACLVISAAQARDDSPSLIHAFETAARAYNSYVERLRTMVKSPPQNLNPTTDPPPKKEPT